MMRPKRTFVKCFVVRNSPHYIIAQRDSPVSLA